MLTRPRHAVFTLDRELGSFVLTQRDLRMPVDTSEFAINMSNQRHWEAPMQRYIGELLAGKWGRADATSTCAGWRAWWPTCTASLTRGGIFIYPLDAKIAAQGGKLRLMYEANPMAFIVEQGWRRRQHRARAHPRGRAAEAAPARAGVPRLEERGGAGGGLPRRARRRRRLSARPA